jgi:exodeoxyribonuclease VII large subunit
VREAAARLEGFSARLEGASYQAVLARGFALVHDRAGRPVTRAIDVRSHAKLVLRFADGPVRVTADGTAGAGQGALPL